MAPPVVFPSPINDSLLATLPFPLPIKAELLTLHLPLIIVEPNPFLAEWTLADGEFAYFQRALSMILSYYNLMEYSADAKGTKESC